MDRAVLSRAAFKWTIETLVRWTKSVLIFALSLKSFHSDLSFSARGVRSNSG